MFREELKAELKQNYDSIKNIDKEIINIKVAIHNLEKLGFNTNEFYDKLDEMCIEFKKLKDFNDDFTKKNIKIGAKKCNI